VALGGSQALGQPKKFSDIDLFIVVKPGFLWLVRTMVSLYFQILGLRRHGKNVANRFCLNHYVAEQKVVDRERNLYKAMEYVRLRPLIYPQGLVEFLQVNAEWIKVFFVQPVQANAPDVKVNVVVENSGVLMPVGGAYIRWRDGCGGSYGFKCALNDPAKTPRRYATTGVDGIHLFKKFQTADRGKEFATILDGFTDPDFPGPVRMMAPSAGQKFGCGQEDHKLAIMAQGYVCDEYKVGAPTTKASDYTKLGCPSGWCEGDLKFEGDCSNGCPQKEYTFKCKGQAIGDKKEVKRSEVGLGSDDPKTGILLPTLHLNRF
jgi:hypothetical protein